MRLRLTILAIHAERLYYRIRTDITVWRLRAKLSLLWLRVLLQVR